MSDMGAAAQLVNDFKVVKESYFELKRKHLSLLSNNDEVVDGEQWQDSSLLEEMEIFENRKQLHDEAQQLYQSLKKLLRKLDQNQEFSRR